MVNNHNIFLTLADSPDILTAHITPHSFNSGLNKVKVGRGLNSYPSQKVLIGCCDVFRFLWQNPRLRHCSDSLAKTMSTGKRTNVSDGITYPRDLTGNLDIWCEILIGLAWGCGEFLNTQLTCWRLGFCLLRLKVDCYHDTVFCSGSWMCSSSATDSSLAQSSTLSSGIRLWVRELGENIVQDIL